MYYEATGQLRCEPKMLGEVAAAFFHGAGMSIMVQQGRAKLLGGYVMLDLSVTPSCCRLDNFSDNASANYRKVSVEVYLSAVESVFTCLTTLTKSETVVGQ